MALSNAEKQKRYRDRLRREITDLRRDGPAPPPDPLEQGENARHRQLRHALGVMAGTWPADEMAKSLEGTDEAILIGERLDPALEWLTAFSAAFHKQSG